MTTQGAPTRTINGVELPTPGRWMIDPVHSQVEFVARHMMISKVRGRFREFAGEIHIMEQPEESWTEATILAVSIDTGDADRDAHLRAPEFLDADRYPEIRFRSTSVRAAGDRWRVDGDLTVREITRSVPLTVEFCGVGLDPWGNTRAAFLASSEINRDEFDITWNQALETGGFLVGNGVKIEIDIEAVRDDG
jgi:polyisoprenoid-binding protein YceI